MQTPNQFELSFTSLHTLHMKNYCNLVFKKIKQIHFKARFSFHIFLFPHSEHPFILQSTKMIF